MREAVIQVLQNLRANKLRSFLTMFGILWGVISVVVLSATGEGFQRGNQHVLEELGKNVGIIWGGRTSLQAGGERSGRQILLTVDDARALARESEMIAVVSPEIQRGGVSVKSPYNAAALTVHGIEPQYQAIINQMSNLVVAVIEQYRITKQGSLAQQIAAHAHGILREYDDDVAEQILLSAQPPQHRVHRGNIR